MASAASRSIRSGVSAAALARYYELFPEAFRCRTPEQGLWMPFAKISQVRGWQDFGFKFKEGNDETRWDDAHGILTFRYTEPMTWWMPMPKDDAAHARRGAGRGQAPGRQGRHGGPGPADQRLPRRRRPLRCPPAGHALVQRRRLEHELHARHRRRGDRFQEQVERGQFREQLYGPRRNGDLDGEYVDSSEGYVTDELDFRRDHFAAAGTPLVFSPEDRRPAIFRGLIAFEYVRGIAGDIHGHGQADDGQRHARPTLAGWPPGST